jgi:lipoyl synthase
VTDGIRRSFAHGRPDLGPEVQRDRHPQGPGTTREYAWGGVDERAQPFVKQREEHSPLSATRSRSNPGGTQDVLSVLGVSGDDVQPFRGRKPPWFKVPVPGGPRYRDLQELIKAENLHTVCQEAACPNIGECWQRGTATFMILGDTCTRRCGFCNVKTGKPTWNDPLEPARVARSVARMGLRHAVITSVDRDDMPDYGAHAFVGVIRQIRRQSPATKVEVLTPDFRGQEMPLAKVIAERPDVFNHNVEVVPRLYPVARRGSTWARSNRVLRTAKEMGGEQVVTKSGLMVGLGESFEEMLDALGTLRENQVQVLTVGQYLRPTEQHLPIVRYWHPEEFERLEREAYAMGFEHVAAGPLVRSSYHADQHVAQAEPGVGPLKQAAAG